MKNSVEYLAKECSEDENSQELEEEAEIKGEHDHRMRCGAVANHGGRTAVIFTAQQSHGRDRSTSSTRLLKSTVSRNPHHMYIKHGPSQTTQVLSYIWHILINLALNLQSPLLLCTCSIYAPALFIQGE